MTKDEILRVVRGTKTFYANDGQIMGRRLTEFTDAEQVEILHWALRSEQQRSASLLECMKCTADVRTNS